MAWTFHVGCTVLANSISSLSPKIVLPSGAYLRLGSMLTLVRIFGSSGDKGNTEGLCGTLNGNPKDDIRIPSGELPMCGKGDEEDCHSAFASAWRCVM